jgi:hypothetical protein
MNDAETPQAEPSAESDPEIPLPPATFEYLVFSLRTQAELSLGLLHFGEEKETVKPEFRSAQHAIDLLAVLQEKTRGNLSIDEQRLLENSLTELRFRYVQRFDESNRK